MVGRKFAYLIRRTILFTHPNKPHRKGGMQIPMEVTVEHLGSVQFEIHARNHSIISDQSVNDGGFDEGMTPPELLLASLGSCAGFYASQYLKRHNLAAKGTRVRVTADKVKDPPRMDNFRIEVELPLAFGEQHRSGIREA